MRLVQILAVLSCLSFSSLALAAEPAPAQGSREGKGASSVPATCEHGVQKALCARCNPKLAPVFKAKGDWCSEHDRPESQCAICNPELAKKGVK